MKSLKTVSSLLVILLLATGAAFASGATILLPEDSSTLLPEHKLNRKEFLRKYGRDDSSRALIAFFYYKRGASQGTVASGAVMGIVSGIAFDRATNVAESGNASFADAFYAFALSMVVAAGIAVFSIGTVIWIRYSRKRLLRLLKDYFNGKSIPRGIRKNKLYRSLLE
jgi:hypothetical protein